PHRGDTAAAGGGGGQCARRGATRRCRWRHYRRCRDRVGPAAQLRAASSARRRERCSAHSSSHDGAATIGTITAAGPVTVTGAITAYRVAIATDIDGRGKEKGRPLRAAQLKRHAGGTS